jgi:epoxyqueuosine reductase
MLINKKLGSYFLISSIFLDKKLDLSSKPVEPDHCGTCTRCIDACPTSAIIDGRQIDASKCISTFTIEMFKDNVEAPKGYPSEREEIFGCDICQDVCPWNAKPLLRSELGNYAAFEKTFKNIDLTSISNREFKRVFKGTSLERTGRVGILKNIKYLPS